MVQIVDLIDEVIMNYENYEAVEAVGEKVNEMMGASNIRVLIRHKIKNIEEVVFGLFFL